MNKLKQFSLMLTLTTLFTLSSAEYQAIIGTANHNIKFVQWEVTSPINGSWVNSDNPYDCSNWAPATTTKPIGEQFTQTATDCKQKQDRQVQLRSKDKISGQIKITGNTTETQIINNQTNTRLATGNQPAEECKYVYTTQSGNGGPNYYILTDGGNSYAYWNGVSVGKGVGRNPTVYIKDGYRYYSTKIMRMIVFIYYDICRKPL